MTSSRLERELAFRDCFAAHFGDLLAYARRRTDQPADASDVVAETFLVAWRRFGDVPQGDEARLWLFGVARKVLANHHRGGARRQRLGERLRERLQAPVVQDHAEDLVRRSVVRAAMEGLTPTDRELLALSAWEQLEPREIAVVLDISPGAARTRLNRARIRLKEAIGDDLEPSGHAPDEAAQLIEEHR